MLARFQASDMHSRFSRLPALALTLLGACSASLVGAVPITPASDAEVIEVLPATAAGRSAERQLRRQLAARPTDARVAVAVARRHLEQAHEAGDPRYAGLALAALQGWPDAATAPDDILLTRAAVQQYLHEFDASVVTLRTLLARQASAQHAQAWLTLATVLRLQGHYPESNAACREIARVPRGDAVYEAACLAENAALRGDVARARASLGKLFGEKQRPASTRAWLATSLAELEERDGRTAAADAAYRAALQLAPDAYARLAYADFLIAGGRAPDALALLRHEPRSDAVLLRLAIGGALSGAPSAARDAAEMRERIAIANERPDARILHGREQAMFALAVEHAPAKALAIARDAIAKQREPLDLLVFARAARASGDPVALDEVRRLKREIGLHDRRIDALL